MLNYQSIQIGVKLSLSCIALLLTTACSTIPNNSSISAMGDPSFNSHKLHQTIGDEIVQSAGLQMDTPYKFGGNSPNEGFDCSGLALYSHRINGISIPRSTSDQFKFGKHINRTALNAGDLLFFRTMGQRVSHVGIYVENDKFIHAPNSRKNVQIDSLDEPYYKKRYLGARRYW